MLLTDKNNELLVQNKILLNELENKQKMNNVEIYNNNKIIEELKNNIKNLENEKNNLAQESKLLLSAPPQESTLPSSEFERLKQNHAEETKTLTEKTTLLESENRKRYYNC